MAGRTLTIDITTADAQTLAALKRVQKQLDATGTEAEQAGAKARKGLDLQGVLAGVAVGAGLKKVVGEYEEAEVTARATAAAIKSTGNAAQISAAQQDQMVTSLSKVARSDAWHEPRIAPNAASAALLASIQPVSMTTRRGSRSSGSGRCSA